MGLIIELCNRQDLSKIEFDIEEIQRRNSVAAISDLSLCGNSGRWGEIIAMHAKFQDQLDEFPATGQDKEEIACAGEFRRIFGQEHESSILALWRVSEPIRAGIVTFTLMDRIFANRQTRIRNRALEDITKRLQGI